MTTVAALSGDTRRNLSAPSMAAASFHIGYALDLIHTVCQLAGSFSLIDDIRESLAAKDVLQAVREHNSEHVFEWLMANFSLQGISDAVATSFMKRHGRLRSRDLAKGLQAPPSCPKLRTYWHFDKCGYHKGSGSCFEPEHFLNCPLPTHPLRNGRLNQTAYSLFLFIRDAADGDLIHWIDRQLAAADLAEAPDRVARMRNALIDPLCNVYGVSHKVLTMTLSQLLIGGGQERERWNEVGVSMIAVDTLVHNFLHRTGIIQRLGGVHRYGTACYQTGGCADLIEQLSAIIDARAFNQNFPPVFPRFVQHAIWRYCAQAGLDVCNGNRIDDRERCQHIYCRLYSNCDRRHLFDQSNGVN